MNSRRLLGQYAGFFSRACALILDLAIIGLAIVAMFLVIDLVFYFFPGINAQDCMADSVSASAAANRPLVCTTINVLWSIIVVSVAPVYFVFLTMATGQTIGQYAMGVRVVGLDGRPIGLLRSIIRWLGMLLSGALLGIGFLWVLIDDRRQGWHDKLARTCVVYAWRAEQNELLLDRVRGFFGRRTAVVQTPGQTAQSSASLARNYDLVTIAVGEYGRLEQILNVVQYTIARGLIKIVSATVLEKRMDGSIGVKGVNDLATGIGTSTLGVYDLKFADYELEQILHDVPYDSFVLAVVLEEQWADTLTKTVARNTTALIRRYDLGDSPAPAIPAMATPAPATPQTAVAVVAPPPHANPAATQPMGSTTADRDGSDSLQ